MRTVVHSLILRFPFIISSFIHHLQFLFDWAETWNDDNSHQFAQSLGVGFFSISSGYSSHLADWRGLTPLTTGAGPGQDLKLHLGCWDCTPTPYTTLATSLKPIPNPLRGSAPTSAALRRAVRCGAWSRRRKSLGIPVYYSTYYSTGQYLNLIQSHFSVSLLFSFMGVQSWLRMHFFTKFRWLQISKGESWNGIIR